MKVVGITGWSGSGKTTLLTSTLPLLARKGLSVSTIKHAHHAFDVDQPGKDSYEHRRAGASEVLVASVHRFALMREHRGAPEPSLADLVARLAPVDLVIVEGFKRDRHPKLEVYRPALGKAPIYPDDPSIAAVASDAAAASLVALAGRRVVPLDDVEAIATLLVAIARPAEAAL